MMGDLAGTCMTVYNFITKKKKNIHKQSTNYFVNNTNSEEQTCMQKSKQQYHPMYNQ